MSRHSKHRSGGAQGVQMGLIITPMLDMSFQLLSFFIMIYSPNALEGHLAGKLAPPTNTMSKANDPANIDPTAISDPDPEVSESLIVRIEAVPADVKAMTPEERTLKFGTRKDGEPKTLKIVTKGDPTGQLVSDERHTPTEAAKKLTDELKKQLGDGSKKLNIRIDNPDGHLKYNFLIELYDACKLAGLQNISFIPPTTVREAPIR